MIGIRNETISGNQMKRQSVIANSLLWATAILVSALVGAPAVLTLTLLPSLAVVFVVTARRPVTASCASART